VNRDEKLTAWIILGIIVGAVLLTMLGVKIAEARPSSGPTATASVDHWPGCKTRACDRRVGDRIRARRRAAWCRRHESCRWRKLFLSRPAGWQSWAWSTARCESGLRFHIATGNGFYGGLQFTPSTAWAAGFRRLPHLTTKWEQLTRAIDFARRHGVGHWPVCGR
jgi:hypothetical protein